MKRNKYLEIITLLIIGSFSGLIIFSVAYVYSGDFVYGTGELVFVPIEGGFFGIDADDGEHYDPINLPDAFKIDGLRIEFIIKIRNDLVSYHMWFKIVELLYIKEMKS